MEQSGGGIARLTADEFEAFCELKKIDGFDVNMQNEKAYFESFYSDWNQMYQTIRNLAIDFKSVYEVGCGCGVNLYMFRNRHPELTIGGIDYSFNLLNYAKTILVDGSFECGEAIEIDEIVKYDILISDSVFQYFPSLKYATEVLHKMCNKASKIVFLGELHDKNLEEKWLENRRKSIKNYDELYKGLNRVFVTREWVKNIAESHGRKCIFKQRNNAEYWNSAYIFDAYIY